MAVQTSKSAEFEHARHLVQHELIAWITQLALSPVGNPELFDAVLAAVTEGLEVPYSALVLPRSGDGELVVTAGVGWHDEVVGKLVGPSNALDLMVERGCDVAGEELFPGARPLLAQHGCQDTARRSSGCTGAPGAC